MGVDSGLPDFRGNKGFWNAYPMYEGLNISFVDAANPAHFSREPAFGWGFYGHRLNLYRQTTPHRGFGLLRSWIKDFDLDHFVVTSNVDGQFQVAKYDQRRIYEVHGSINYLQCTEPCGKKVWKNQIDITVDQKTMTATNLPECRYCGQVARPNILMFGDFTWVPERYSDQEDRFQAYLAKNKQSQKLVIEIGAGSAVPTIRYLSEQLGWETNTRVIRINPREPFIGSPHISLPLGCVEALNSIDQQLKIH